MPTVRYAALLFDFWFTGLSDLATSIHIGLCLHLKAPSTTYCTPVEWSPFLKFIRESDAHFRFPLVQTVTQVIGQIFFDLQ